MTEQEWLTCEDPEVMLSFLDGRVSNRKLVLFCLDWCPVYWMESFNGDPAYHRALQFAETGENLDLVRLAWEDTASEWEPCFPERPWQWALVLTDPAYRDEFGTPSPNQAPPFLRDIFGNPFRPVALDPAWLTSDVVALVWGIYEDRAFDRMPILADALQDAGCDNADVLNHCRDESVHARGCWVIDLVLGKM